jgi:hypothetical protein
MLDRYTSGVSHQRLVPWRMVAATALTTERGSLRRPFASTTQREHGVACGITKTCDQREHRWWMHDGLLERGSSPVTIRAGHLHVCFIRVTLTDLSLTRLYRCKAASGNEHANKQASRVDRTTQRRPRVHCSIRILPDGIAARTGYPSLRLGG